MKITKSQLRQIIKEELESVLNEVGEPTWHADPAAVKTMSKYQYGKLPPEEEEGLDSGPVEGVPEEAVVMETLWDVVRHFYKLGLSDVAFKLQKVAEMADPSHKRPAPREFGGERHEPSLDDEPGLEL